MIGITLFSKMKNGTDEKWYSFKYVVLKKLTEMIVLILMILALIIFLNESFFIDTLSVLNVTKYWKIVFSIWMLLNIVSGKRLYDWLEFGDFLQRVKDGKYGYTTPEIMILDIIERCNSKYELQKEKLGILKSLTPISVIPLIGGYILEGKKVAVDWNIYTISFFAILIWYFYSLWKCYKDMQLLKRRKLEIQRELTDIQYKSKK